MRRIHRYLIGLLPVLVPLLIPDPAAPQNVYADQVHGYLDEFESRVLDADHVLEGEAYGWMMDGAEGATIVRLPAGSYVVLGACDDDCSDIDLAVTRIDNREELGADRELDSFPIVQFSLTEPGEVRIEMSMPDCGTARCYTGYRWFSSDVGLDASLNPSGDVSGWEAQVMSQLEVVPTPDDVDLVDERTGLVGAGEAGRFSLTLEPGSYGGVAVCDYDCSDIDLVVYDPDGTMITSDVLEDDVPVVEMEVTGKGGSHTFEVRMVSCATASCGYGFRLYRQDLDEPLSTWLTRRSPSSPTR